MWARLAKLNNNLAKMKDQKKINKKKKTLFSLGYNCLFVSC